MKCKREGCENNAKIVGGGISSIEYCSEACERYEFKKGLYVLGKGPKPTKPENVARRTPEEMKAVVESYTGVL